MGWGSIHKPGLPKTTVIPALVILALVVDALSAKGLGQLGQRVQAQSAPYTLDENIRTFPDSVAPRSGIVEVDPALAPVSRPARASPSAGGDGRVRPEVIEALKGQADVPVIVSLQIPAAPAASPSDITALRGRVEAVQDQVLSSLAPSGFRLTNRYQVTPALAGLARSSAVVALANHPNVVAVSIDRKVRASLGESVPLINGDSARALGFTGAGVVTAILDTGLDTDHPDLGDDLLGEECRLSETSDCPNGTATQSGPGAAEDDHGHGSHVAGIITGGGVVASPGVAPDAGIVAYKVLNSAGTGSISDVLAAADDIIANHPEVGIINMSLGDQASHVPGTCDDDTPALTSAFATLRGQDVVSFAASGNHALKTGINYPACVSPIVSVGMVYDANVGPITWGGGVCTDLTTAADQVPCISNSHPDLDLLGPGALITSASLVGPTSTKGGTSMASPHAAGVAALVRQAAPALTADSLVTALESTGVSVTDAANGVTTPRVDALAAVEAATGEPTVTPTRTATMTPTATVTPTTTPAGTPTPGFGVNVRVNQDGQTQAQNEPSIAANPADPTRLVAGSNDYRTFPPAFADGHPGVYFSINEGASWSDAGGGPVAGILPNPPGFVWGSRHTPGQLAGGDPALAWGPGANVYYGFIGFNSVDCSAGGVYVSRSADAGATWETPVSVWPNADTQFQDKPYIAVDGNPGSPFFGRVYVSWTRFQNLQCGGPMTGSLIVLSHSDDGETWSTPRTVSGPRSSCNQGSAPEVAADGSLHVAWWNCDTAPQRILAAKSTDGGDSFSTAVQVAQVATIPSPLPPSSFRSNSFPAIAADSTNPSFVYVTWANDPAGTDDADIFFCRSTDGGASWSTPIRVNDDATLNDQFFPWLSVSPEGRVDIVFGDRRDDPADTLYHTYYAGSTDGGASFAPNVRVTDVPSDPDVGFDGLFIGDYFNVVSGSIHPAWTDTRNGHQDIFTAVGTGAATDSDGDGCTDAQELAMGFDPFAWYDFFDVPVPANPDPNPNGAKSGAITLGDVLAVLRYVGTQPTDVCGDNPNPNSVDYDCDKGLDTDGDTLADIPPDGVSDGLDYDRSPSAEPDPPWDAGNPDGAVTLSDVLAAAAQVGLSCVGTP